MPRNPARIRPPSAETLALAGLWAGFADLAAAGLLLALAVDGWAPAQDLPWKPLSLNDPVGLATGVKFARAAADPLRCRAVLRQGGVSFSDAPDREPGGCSIANAVRLRDGVAIPLSPPAPEITCPLALSYAFWTKHVVQPAAGAELGGRVVSIEHYGAFACRNIYGRARAPRSEHASANAIDVAGFRLADGRRVTVAGDFHRSDARGRFVRRAREGACDWFHAVLSPDYNAAHRDHLHLDFGAYRACR